MDKTDMILIQLLLQNSRRPYRELADTLNLSVNAAHKRIHELIESGILRTFTAKINLSAFEKAVSVWVWGRSEAKSLDEIITKLGKDSSTYWVTVASGNILYLGAHIPDISKLDSYLAFVKKEGQIPDPTVAIIYSPAHAPSSLTSKRILSSLDYRIIYSLHKNSRKRITEVSEEIGVSAKTIQRRLSRMVDEGLIELSMEFFPDVSNDLFTIFHLNLKASADRSKVAPLLINKYSPNVVYPISCSNLPNLFLCVVWTNTMKELQDIRQCFENEGIFESVEPNVSYTGYIFDTWRDEVLQKKGSPPK